MADSATTCHGGVAVLNSDYIKGAGHSGSDLATQNMMSVAFRPGAASLNPEAAKLPKAFAFNSLLFSAQTALEDRKAVLHHRLHDLHKLGLL